MTRVTRRRRIIRYAVGSPPAHREDVVAVEEPLQIRVSAWASGSIAAAPRDLTVTMRTPGHDFDLVAGFLVGEGVVRKPDDIAMMRYCAGTNDAGEQTFNVVDVTLGSGIPLPGAEIERQVLTTSACGICGTTSIDQVRKALRPDLADPSVSWRVSVAVLLALPDALQTAQGLFAKTGGAARGATSAARDGPSGERPSILRVGAEGGAGRHTRPCCCGGALVTGRGARRRTRGHPHRFQPRSVTQRLYPPRSRRGLTGGGRHTPAVRPPTRSGPAARRSRAGHRPWSAARHDSAGAAPTG